MHREGHYNEKKVLEMLAQGSEYAFTELFDHYRGRLFGVALRFLKSRHMAEEVVQEVFLKVDKPLTPKLFRSFSITAAPALLTRRGIQRTSRHINAPEKSG